jgi:hypothetical protein
MSGFAQERNRRKLQKMRPTLRCSCTRSTRGITDASYRRFMYTMASSAALTCAIQTTHKALGQLPSLTKVHVQVTSQQVASCIANSVIGHVTARSL